MLRKQQFNIDSFPNRPYYGITFLYPPLYDVLGRLKRTPSRTAPAFYVCGAVWTFRFHAWQTSRSANGAF